MQGFLKKQVCKDSGVTTIEQCMALVYEGLITTSKELASAFPLKDIFIQVVQALVDSATSLLKKRAEIYTEDSKTKACDIFRILKPLPEVSMETLGVFVKAVKAIEKDILIATDQAGKLILAVEKDAGEFSCPTHDLCHNFQESWIH